MTHERGVQGHDLVHTYLGRHIDGLGSVIATPLNPRMLWSTGISVELLDFPHSQWIEPQLEMRASVIKPDLMACASGAPAKQCHRIAAGTSNLQCSAPKDVPSLKSPQCSRVARTARAVGED